MLVMFFYLCDRCVYFLQINQRQCVSKLKPHGKRVIVENYRIHIAINSGFNWAIDNNTINNLKRGSWAIEFKLR